MQYLVSGAIGRLGAIVRLNVVAEFEPVPALAITQPPLIMGLDVKDLQWRKRLAVQSVPKWMGNGLHGLLGLRAVPIVNNFDVAIATILNPIMVGVIARAKILPVRIVLEACVNVSSSYKANIWQTEQFDLLLKLTIDFYFAAGLHSIVLYGTEPPTEVSDNASGVPVDVSLWIGLLVALVVFILAFLFIVKMMLRKKRLPASGYTLTTSGGKRELIWNLTECLKIVTNAILEF